MEDKRKMYYEGSKIPPQAIDLEEGVLGALMVDPSAFDLVNEILSEEVFYKESHGIIYKAIFDLKLDNNPVDILTVKEELNKKGKLELVGGAYQITKLTHGVISASNIVSHSLMIREKFILREMIRISGDIQAMAFDSGTDFSDALDYFEEQMQPIRDFLGGINPYTPWSKLLDDENKRINQIAKSKDVSLLGCNTGSETLNRVLGGFRKSDLIIVAARPGIGKTTRSLAYAKAAALTGKLVVVFSLEMAADQLVRKFIIEESEVYSSKLLLGTLSEKDLSDIDNAVVELKKLPIEIIDKSGVKPMYIKSIIRKIKKKRGEIGLIVIDYLQLMNSNVSVKGNREQEVSSISKALKELAKDEDVPVLALSQLSRELEKRSNKRPMLSDLRESGSIEQDADSVLMLYSPSKYYRDKIHDPDYKDNDNINQEEYEQIIETWIMKNRHGAADIFILERFDKSIGRFKYFDPDQKTQQPLTMPQDTSWQQSMDFFKVSAQLPDNTPPF